MPIKREYRITDDRNVVEVIESWPESLYDTYFAHIAPNLELLETIPGVLLGTQLPSDIRTATEVKLLMRANR